MDLTFYLVYQGFIAEIGSRHAAHCSQHISTKPTNYRPGTNQLQTRNQPSQPTIDQAPTNYRPGTNQANQL